MSLPAAGRCLLIRDQEKVYDIRELAQMGVAMWVVDKATGAASDVGHRNMAGPRHSGTPVES